MNRNGVSVADVVAEASVWTNGDDRARARATVFGTVNDVAVRPGGKARLESRTPALIGVVDDHESCVPPSESDELRRRGDPVGDVRGLDGVPETDHSGDGGPTVLAVPAVGSRISGASTRVSVGCARILIAELIAGQNGRRTEGMCQDPDVSERVHVVCGVYGQGLTVAFRVMVRDEGVGETAVTRRIPLGLWTTEGSDTVVLERRLEIECVLEGFDLTKPGVFARGNAIPATVVNLRCAPVRATRCGYCESSYLLGNVRGLPGQTTKDCLEISNGNI